MSDQRQSQRAVRGQRGVLGAGRSLFDVVDHPHADVLAIIGKAQRDQSAVGQLALDVGIAAGQDPTQPADLLFDPGEVLPALQRVGGVTAIPDALRVVGAFGTHLIAPPTQFGQFRLEASVFLLGKASRFIVWGHARQSTVMPH